MFHMLALMPPVGYYWNSGVCMCQSATRKSKVPAFSQPCGRVLQDATLLSQTASQVGSVAYRNPKRLPFLVSVV
jgi:hypothetical protein